MNYYSKFLPNLSTKLAPLYKLLNKKQHWIWGTEQQQAFREARALLQADLLLAHYDPSKPLVVACDASQYGIGAVLSHVLDDETERPIAYVSRTLSTAEKHYSQLGLAIIFAVKKFHYYIYGRSFAIESDHRPLMFLFGERNGIPQMASSRIQRWALTLLMLLNHLSSTTVSATSIKQWTSQDPTLSCVRRYIETGWPEQPQQLSKEFQPYVSLRLELSVLDGCILRGSCVVIPPPGRQLVLDELELHDTHTGITKMKSLARSFVWWPGMDAQIEKLVKSCAVCQESRPSPAPAPLHPWEWPSEPWSRLHIDFAGPFLNHMFMVANRARVARPSLPRAGDAIHPVLGKGAVWSSAYPWIQKQRPTRLCRKACGGVSLFGGMEWWNGTVEWNSGMVEYWNSGITTPTDSGR